MARFAYCHRQKWWLAAVAAGWGPLLSQNINCCKAFLGSCVSPSHLRSHLPSLGLPLVTITTFASIVTQQIPFTVHRGFSISRFESSFVKFPIICCWFRFCRFSISLFSRRVSPNGSIEGDGIAKVSLPALNVFPAQVRKHSPFNGLYRLLYRQIQFYFNK